MRIKTNLNNKKIGSITSKHLLAVRDYWTVKKVVNLIRSEFEQRRLRPIVHTMPYTATIDITNICNLHCPGCPTGLGLEGRKRGYIDLDIVKKFLDETAEYLFIANLYNWGESLLHPSASEIVRLFHDRKVFTSISTNLNIQDFGRIRSVCEAGLDHLIVSADGSTEASYQSYRKGGSFSLVLENVRKLMEYKRVTGSKTPLVEWQLLSFSNLESEIGKAFALARQENVDWFTVRGPMAPEGLQPASDEYKGEFYGGNKKCGLLWHNITLQCDGGIAPCCFIYHKNDDFGTLGDEAMARLRNNAKFTTARRLFDRRLSPETALTMHHPCLRCPVIHQLPNLGAKLKDHPSVCADPGFMAIVSNEKEMQTVRDRFQRMQEQNV